MPVSCIGTCSNCAAQRFWISDVFSLQLDDGKLKCLPHPGEGWKCEKEGLTLAQASERGRLFREIYFVCRNCGKEGETIQKHFIEDRIVIYSVWKAMMWGWGSAAIISSFFMWMKFWQGAVVLSTPLVILPWINWRENQKTRKELAAKGLPRADAPGLVPVAAPTSGCRPQVTIVGQPLPAKAGEHRATGMCCDKPDWIEAFRVEDEDRVPCTTCGRGVMTVSDHAIH